MEEKKTRAANGQNNGPGATDRITLKDLIELAKVPAEDHGDGVGSIPLADLDVGSDAWFACLAAEAMRERLAYVPNWGWWYWDGKRWKKDGEQVLNIALKVLTRRISKMAEEAESKKQRKKLFQAASRIQDKPRLVNAVYLAKGWLSVEPDEFDNHPTLLNTPSGVVDLETGELRPHDPALKLTQITGVPYDPDAECPRFEAFLSEIFAGNDDLINYLHRLLGYSLLGHNAERLFVVFWGHGRNGKSTLCAILANVLGDYLKEARPESFEVLRSGDVRPRNDLAVLKAARVVTANEAREGAKFDAALIKQVAGGSDLITARYLYKEDFSFRPAFLPILRTNFKPRLPGGDPALWDRIQLVPFTVQIPPERQDRNLADRICAEEGPGVLAWLVRGCLEYMHEGLNPPQEVRAATEDYRRETDPVWAFVEEHCEQDLAAQEETRVLYEAFRRWWEESDQDGDPPDVRWFGRHLSNLGFEAARSGGKRVRRGLRLKDETPPVE